MGAWVVDKKAHDAGEGNSKDDKENGHVDNGKGMVTTT